MKVADIIIDCERMKHKDTGLYHYCRELSIELVKQSKDVSIDFYVPESAVGFIQSPAIYQQQKWWHKIVNLIATKYKVWHCTYQSSNYFPFNRSVKKILTIHDLNFLYDERKSAEKKSKYLRQVQRHIDQSSYITAISNFTLECVKQHLDLGNKPTAVIYNGCNLPGADLVFTKPACINFSNPFLFSIGTIALKKNFHVLPALLKNNNYYLVIAGINQDNDYLNKILDEAKKHGVQDRLVMPGSVTDAEKFWLLQNMLAFVFPSISEGFGLPVIEAMHFGKPVVLSKHTALPEVGGDAAYYFPSFEADEMQAAFTDALQHYNTHPEQQLKVKQRAALFSWDQSAAAYLDVYKKVLST